MPAVEPCIVGKWLGTPRRQITLLAVAAVLVTAIAPAFAAAPPAAPSPALCHGSNPVMSRARPGPYSIGETQILDLTGDYDGELIHMGVVRPDVPSGTKVPVIVFASPYLDHNLTDGDLTTCAPRLVENFVQHGYAVGFVAVRGTSDSGGCSDLMGNAERADLDQSITWFGEQGWSNGRVGMIGVSYDGSTPWEVAGTGNKYLKTIVPISGVNDIYHLMYHNGAPEFRAPLVLNALYYTYPFFPGDAFSRSREHWVKSIVCPEAFKGFYSSLHSTFTGERDPLGYWAERNSRPGVEKNYKGSIFLARGLQDWNVDPAHDFPWVTELDRKGIFVKYMLGQWHHDWPDSFSEDEVMEPGEPVRWDWADVLLDWWDYWLKNKRGRGLGPRAQVQDSSGEWRNETAWPPADARPTKLFLAGDGSLAQNASPIENSYPIAYDAVKLYSGEAGRNCVCARFTMGPFKEDFRFAGIPEFSATVVPYGPSGHLSATLYSTTGAYSARSAELVGWGMVDLRFAQGGEVAKPVVPGQPMKVTVPLEPLDVVIEKDRSLLLLISQSAYGGNSTSVPDRYSISAFPLDLLVGGDKSTITLHTFTRGPKAFFVPLKKPRPDQD